MKWIDNYVPEFSGDRLVFDDVLSANISLKDPAGMMTRIPVVAYTCWLITQLQYNDVLRPLTTYNDRSSGVSKCILCLFCVFNLLAPVTHGYNFEIFNFENGVSRELLLGDCYNTALILVNICSGNGSVPSGNKPLPEPISNELYDATWRQ